MFYGPKKKNLFHPENNFSLPKVNSDQIGRSLLSLFSHVFPFSLSADFCCFCSVFHFFLLFSLFHYFLPFPLPIVSNLIRMKLFGANLTSSMGGNWTGAALDMAKKVNPMGAVDQLLQTVTALLDALLSQLQSLLSALQLIVPVAVGIFALFGALFLLLFGVLLFFLYRIAFSRQPIDQNVGQKNKKVSDQKAMEEQKAFLGDENEKR